MHLFTKLSGNCMIDEYVTVDGKLLRMGYTTGSSAAAAAKAAAIMLLGGAKLNSVCLMTPKGIDLTLKVEDITIHSDEVSCAVKKDAGDDPDVTNGMLIYAKIALIINENIITITGGEGIGKVTKPGLNQAVGNSAINSVPRSMIAKELQNVKDEYSYEGGFSVIIFAPEGEEIAKRTFNKRLGILGGISILGTSGIVEPMSDSAIIQTIKAEIDIHKANNEKYLVITPGNYGADYIKLAFDFIEDKVIKCSNFIGIALDYAAELDFEGVLLIGHGGKLIKLAGGLFNTHSRYGDCRAEIICSSAVLCGLDTKILQNILQSVTVDEMLVQIEDEKVRNTVLENIIKKISFFTGERVYEKMQIETIVFTQKLGLLAKTKNADALAEKIKEQNLWK